MAITKIWAIKCRVEDAIDYTTNEEKTLNLNYEIENDTEEFKEDYESEYDKYYEEETPNIYNDFDVSFNYATNPEKTEQQHYITALNCFKETAKEEMKITKEQYGKLGGIVAFHLVQSFKENEVSPEIAHEIGVRLAEEIFGERFEVVVSTHLNTKCYHNHFIINSVSRIDGMKYYDTHTTYARIREVSDELCREYKLSVLKEKITNKTNISYTNFQKKYQNTPYYKTTKADIDKAIRQAYTYDDFENILSKMGYTLTYRANKLSVCANNYKRNIRIERAFGKEYTIERIEKRIFEENDTRVPFHDVYSGRRLYTKKKKSIRTKVDKKYRTSLYRLYLYYRYKLNQYRNNDDNKTLTPEQQQAIKQMEQYSEDARFLSSKKIHTSEELFLYKQALLLELENLDLEYMKVIRNGSTTLTKGEIQYKTNLLKKEVEICKRIEERIPKIKEELKPKDEGKEQGKESVQIEHGRRCSRANI